MSPTLKLLNKKNKETKGTSSKLSGSATVEATCIFPFIIFFFISVVWMMDLFCIHSEIGAELNNIGNEMVAYSYPEYVVLSGSENRDIQGLAVKTGWNEIYVKGRLNKLPVSDKILYMSTLLSKTDSKDEIDIVVTYYVKPFIDIPGINGVLLTNHFYSKGFTGYLGKDISEEEYVYITKTGEVYHTTLDCVSLKIKPEEIKLSHAKNRRNNDGSKYYPCEHCGKWCGEKVFITPYGNRYHSTKFCPDLNINVFQIPISEVGNRRKCNHCKKLEK